VPPFPGASQREWTDNQVLLCSLSAFYDDVWACPDRPPDSVVENDHLLDMWLRQRKQRLDIETAERWAKAGWGLGGAGVPAGANVLTAEQLTEADDPMAMVRKMVNASSDGATLSFPNPGARKGMVMTEPSLDTMMKFDPVLNKDREKK